jgi:hypothetical protein
MMKPTLPLLLAGWLFTSCQSTDNNPTGPSLPGIPTTVGPVTAYPDVELFGENPLTAFQRTGNQPLPVGIYPVNTPVRIISRSGAFYQVTMPDGRNGWVAARSVSGVYQNVPDWNAGPGATPEQPVVRDPAMNVPPAPGTAPETIDLDRIP